MAFFTLCCGAAGTGIELAAANWQNLALNQVIVGETSLVPVNGRELIAEIPTTLEDQPCLGPLLAEAASRSQSSWLLLVPPDACLTPAAVQNLEQLCRPGRPRQLVIGRSWRLPATTLVDPSLCLDPKRFDASIAANGHLDSPTHPSWVLLPVGCFHHAPPSLACTPQAAIPWLVKQAHWLGWPVLEASLAISVVRPRDSQARQSQARDSHGGFAKAPLCTGVVLPYAADAPKVTLLLAAPEDQLEPLQAALCPAPSLPWEVIARPDWTGQGPGSLAAAWNSALAEARGELVWPLAAVLPPLALIPVLLRCFDAPWVDLVQLASRLGDQHWPAADPYRVAPGCLVAQRTWIERLGGFDEDLPPHRILQQFRQRALARGASLRHLPLEAITLSA
jgi:Fe-S-cluster formation regulator IscX/YfhJ